MVFGQTIGDMGSSGSYFGGGHGPAAPSKAPVTAPSKPPLGLPPGGVDNNGTPEKPDITPPPPGAGFINGMINYSVGSIVDPAVQNAQATTMQALADIRTLQAQQQEAATNVLKINDSSRILDQKYQTQLDGKAGDIVADALALNNSTVQWGQLRQQAYNMYINGEVSKAYDNTQLALLNLPEPSATTQTSFLNPFRSTNSQPAPPPSVSAPSSQAPALDLTPYLLGGGLLLAGIGLFLH